MGDDVEAPQQDSIERPGARDEARAVGGRDDEVDELVDHRVADPGEVLAAGGAGRLRGPVVPLLVAGGERLGPDLDRHVEVEVLQPVLVLCGVNRATARGDAEPREALY